MKLHLLILAAVSPLLLVGLWLWRDQGAMISLGEFMAWCLG
ncbi:hypothetical protein [Allosphingosinicella sp.]